MMHGNTVFSGTKVETQTSSTRSPCNASRVERDRVSRPARQLESFHSGEGNVLCKADFRHFFNQGAVVGASSTPPYKVKFSGVAC
jgi:hypothetical protein